MTIPGDFMGVRVLGPRTAAAAAWWAVAGKTCVAAYAPKGAASLAASYTNLANPGTHDAAPGVAPTWDATNGWIFDGSSQYLVAPVQLSTSCTMMIRCTLTEAWGFDFFLGSYSGGDTFLLRGGGGGPETDLQFVCGGWGAVATVNFTAGVIAMTGGEGFVDGLSVGTWAVPTLGALPTTTGIGALQNGAGPRGCSVQAVAFYSDTLTASEVATLSAAMAAL